MITLNLAESIHGQEQIVTTLAWIAISLWTSTIAFLVGGAIGFHAGKKEGKGTDKSP
ncbi:MAG: hypothetical protein ACLQUY_20045 [Ktedonobacterales bacterium]